jgi:hypothetical protein
MKNIKLLFCILIITLNNSCTSTTKITSSWREPNKEITINNLKKVLVVALLKNETSRHKAEDQMLRYLNGKGIASYNYSDNNFNKLDEVALVNKVRGDGFDGVVMMRLIDVDKEMTYTPGSYNSFPNYYQNFGGYYRRGWQNYSTPGQYNTTKTFNVETNVYSLKDNKIVWSALTESVNPDGVEQMTAEIADVVYKKMLKEGFVVK